MVKVLCVLYDGGEHAKQQPLLLGTTENAIGIREFAQKRNLDVVVTSDKEGPDSVFAKEIETADVLITTPFHPGYLTRELIGKAKNLKLAITAGVGSDHIDLDAANEKKITVAEVTGSNVVSVAEHVILSILLLKTLQYFKKGAWLVNTARGALCVAEDVAEAVNSGHLAGYAGDVWYPQPAPPDHPWRKMRNPFSGGGNGMVPHMSGTTLDAQKRYATGAIKILENWLDGKPQNPPDLIVENGEYATKAYGQRTVGAKS